jgi:hypothetical protein
LVALRSVWVFNSKYTVTKKVIGVSLCIFRAPLQMSLRIRPRFKRSTYIQPEHGRYGELPL